eukprot:tig00020515_g9779.t1
MASAFALSALSGIRHTGPLSSALYAPAHSTRLAPSAPRAQRQLGFSASPALGRRFRVASESSCTGCVHQARRAFEHARRALRIVAEAGGERKTDSDEQEYQLSAPAPRSGPLTVSFDDADAKEAKSAIFNTACWFAVAFAFAGGISYFQGAEKAAEFISGYIVEQSLSVDNLFVFLLVFNYFQVPQQSQKRVLKWGLIGAAAMRAVMIGLGAAALERFEALFLVFAAVLLWSSFKLLTEGGDDDDEEDLSDNKIVLFARKLVKVSDHYDGEKFFNAMGEATPLLLVLIVIELSDVVFAVDSIPAVFGVTSDPFIVFTSNMFAILSLRSLFFLISTVLAGLRYLQPSLAIVLGFVGAKMVADYFGFHTSTYLSLSVVAGVLGGGITLSLLFPEEDDKKEEEEEAEEAAPGASLSKPSADEALRKATGASEDLAGTGKL